jgi:hypothetical protein
MKTSLPMEEPAFLDIRPTAEIPGKEKTAKPGISKIITRTMAITATETTIKSIRINRPDLAIFIDIADKMKVWDFKRHDMAIEEGYLQARKQLNSYFG